MNEAYVEESAPQSQIWIILLGIAWLVLAGGILYWQYSGQEPITVQWETETEFDTAGFNIYRSQSADGEFVQINPQLIPSKADPASGAAYEYVDYDVEAGQTYFYRLEDVEYDNTRQMHDVIPGSAGGGQTLPLVVAAASIVLGLALLASGIKEARQ